MVIHNIPKIFQIVPRAHHEKIISSSICFSALLVTDKDIYMYSDENISLQFGGGKNSKENNKTSNADATLVLNTILFSTEARPHYSDVIMIAMASQITGVSIVYSTVCLGTDQSKQQSSASLAFVRGIHRWPVNSIHKRAVTLQMFLFDDVIIWNCDRRPVHTEHWTEQEHTCMGIP